MFVLPSLLGEEEAEEEAAVVISDDDEEVELVSVDTAATTTNRVDAVFQVAEVVGLDGSTVNRPTPCSQQLLDP